LQPKASREANKMKYVGVDIGKWKCRAAIMSPEGVLIEEFIFEKL
jgi:activator of 2-hydroxyglutaryl-CoA dehydratase